MLLSGCVYIRTLFFGNLIRIFLSLKKVEVEITQKEHLSDLTEKLVHPLFSIIIPIIAFSDSNPETVLLTSFRCFYFNNTQWDYFNGNVKQKDLLENSNHTVTNC